MKRKTKELVNYLVAHYRTSEDGKQLEFVLQIYWDQIEAFTEYSQLKFHPDTIACEILSIEQFQKIFMAGMDAIRQEKGGKKLTEIIKDATTT